MKLVGPLDINESDFNEFVDEFKAAGEDLVPYSLNQKGLDFEAYVASLQNESLGIDLPEGWVPASTYFLSDDAGRICGAVNIRHRLTEKLRQEGGHIGYGIRPSARDQGYGTKILELALHHVREMGIKKALVTCNRENVGSARVIQKNGGQLDSEFDNGDWVVQRYWIEL